jgi:hypothetical protein
MSVQQEANQCLVFLWYVNQLHHMIYLEVPFMHEKSFE